jgi:hypothetical protein
MVGIKAHGLEILFEYIGDTSGAASTLLEKATRTGNRYRLHVEEAELYSTIEMLRETGARILSVTQMKASLEEYFMHLIEADRAQAAAVDVSGK